MLMGLPGALDPGLPSLRAVADFPKSHFVGEGQTKDTIRDTESRALPVRTGHPRHPHEAFKRRQLRTRVGCKCCWGCFLQAEGEAGQRGVKGG